MNKLPTQLSHIFLRPQSLFSIGAGSLALSRRPDRVSSMGMRGAGFSKCVDRLSPPPPPVPVTHHNNRFTLAHPYANILPIEG